MYQSFKSTNITGDTFVRI